MLETPCNAGPPEIVDCQIVRRTTQYDRDVIRPQTFAFSEILMTDAKGRSYCSRTWDVVSDTSFSRAHLVEQFRKRWAASH